MFGTIGAAFGTIASSTLVAVYGVWRMTRPDSVIHFEPGMDKGPDFTIIRSLFRFGLPTGVQGIAMNIGGVLLLRFIGSLPQSAAAQAAYAVGYTELFSLITWTSVGLDGRRGDDRRSEPRRRQSRARDGGRAVASRIGLGVAAVVGRDVRRDSRAICSPMFGMTDPVVLSTRTAAAAVPERVRASS